MPLEIYTPDRYKEYTDLFRAGTEEGFTFYFRLFHPALCYYCKRIIGFDHIMAENIVQESFIKIWERHKTFTHSKVIKGWLYTTVRNAAINHLQSLKRQQKLDDKYAKEYVDEDLSPEEQISAAEEKEFLNKLPEYLPGECRKIFEALYIEGLTVREIHERTGLAITTIKNQKGRGLSILRKRLGIVVSTDEHKTWLRIMRARMKKIRISNGVSLNFSWRMRNRIRAVTGKTNRKRLLLRLLPAFPFGHAQCIQLYIDSLCDMEFVKLMKKREITARQVNSAIDYLEAFMIAIRPVPKLTDQQIEQLELYTNKLVNSEKYAVRLAITGSNILTISEKTASTYRLTSDRLKRISKQIYQYYPHPLIELDHMAFFRLLNIAALHGMSKTIKQLMSKQSEKDIHYQQTVENVAVVRELRRKNLSYGQIARHMGVPRTTVQRWDKSA